MPRRKNKHQAEKDPSSGEDDSASDGIPPEPEACELCGRDDLELEMHHLIARAMHRKPRAERFFTKQEMRTRIAWLCAECHDQIHSLFSERELSFELNTVERLLEREEVLRFIQYVRKKH